VFYLNGELYEGLYEGLYNKVLSPPQDAADPDLEAGELRRVVVRDADRLGEPCSGFGINL
jgi:hypothetical protein